MTDKNKERKNPHAVAMGRKGGKSKSAKKIAAIMRNLEKAAAKRNKVSLSVLP
jgi:hypothetical protein